MALDDAFATSGLQDTLVVVWRGDPTPERVSALAEHLRGIARRNDGRVFLFNVITATTPLPSPESRTRLQAEFASMRGQLKAASIVLEKMGVDGAVSRAVLSTLITISRRPFPMRVFPARRDAASWLGTVGCSASTAALLSLADSLAMKLRSVSSAPSGGQSSPAAK
jgi:hypothetical protein